MIYDVIIIGAGPAGMSAGIYLCRKKLSALILSEDVGGQMARSWDIENFIGYHLISGADLTEKFKEHLASYDCLTLKSGQKIQNIKKQKKTFIVQNSSKENFEAKTVIIATGKNPRLLGVANEDKFRGRGLTYCATCDAPLFNNKKVAVIGDGNSALGATYQLGKIASKIYLMITGPKFRNDLDKILKENTLSSDRVEVIYNSQVIKIYGDKVVAGLEYRDIKTKKVEKLELQGIFVEIGSVAAVSFINKLVKLNQLGEIIIDKANMTSVPGIFAAGDVSDVVEKQVIIAAGEGAKAAISVAKYLSSHKM